MSESKDDDAFLSRWSRRKVAAREGEPLPEPKPAEPVPAAAAGTAVPEVPARPELPSLESLEGLKSDYRAFMQPGVDEDVKRAAIKKLFADPQFNVMDGLDVYIDDYTQFEPLSPGMLDRIAAVKHLFRTPEPEPREAGADEAAARDQPEAAASLESAPPAEAATPVLPAGDIATISTGPAILEPKPHSAEPSEET
ncbi:MAG: DUF3306 domain-containing protein [Burkholderiales bacterium]|jgi:hypothetical protein|nr:DUF3306 domain-containing protein [Burkholderiales bacterium]